MRILRATDHKRMPWKNGGGETVEIAVFPPGASINEFDWRVSTATVASDGPFSTFPGIDRTLSILTGGGMELTIEGEGVIALMPGDQPYAFPADRPTTARLLGGTLTDLNVMTRRGRFEHRVERLLAPANIPASAHLRLLFCLDGNVTLKGGVQALEIGAFDCLVLEPDNIGITVSGTGNLYLIDLKATVESTGQA